MVSESIANKKSVGKSSSARLDALCLALLALTACLAFIPYLGSAGMFDPTDSFFIEAGREMLETHKFIVPLMNYEQWLDKPALDFCLIAGSLATFGINEFAGRLPAACSGVLEALVLFGLSRQVLSRRQAFLSALVLLASPLFIVVGRTSLSDEPLSLCFSVSLLSFAVAAIKDRPKFLLPAYAALGVAILLKGPPLALILTGFVVAGYLVLTERTKALVAAWKLHPLEGLLGAAVIAFPYYIWAHIGTNGEFTTNFFLRQNLGRAAGTVNHVRPFWWYVPVLLGGIFPWSFSLAFGGRYLKRIIVHAEHASTNRLKFLKFASCWSLLGFIFFSAVPTKLETYIVPILPAIALLVGCYLDVLVRANHRKSSRMLLSTLIALTTLISVSTPIAINFVFKDSEQNLFGQIIACVILVAGCFFAILQLRKGRAETAVFANLFTMAAYGAIFIPCLFIAYHKAYQQPVDRLIAYAHSEHADLAVLFFSMPSAMFQYRHAIPLIKAEREMRSFADGGPDKRWILMNKDVLSLLKWTERSPRVVAHEGRWWLFAVGKNCMKENTAEWNGPNVGVYPTLADKHH